MRTLARLASDKQALPQRLPDIFQTLAQADIRFWRATVHMIAGVPGSMKTFLTLYMVARMGLPTLYFSADTDSGRILKRCAAMVSGLTQEEVQRRLEADDHAFTDDLAKLDHIRWVFESDPTYKDLEQEISAFAEAYGDFPAVIVVDTLMNVVGENEDEWGSMRDTTRAFHRLTRITNAAVFVQHHMGEKRTDPSSPAPRSDLQGKVAQLPEVILSLAFDGVSQLKVAPVKNRDGSADASGRTFTSIFVDPQRGQFYDNHYAYQNGNAA